MNTPQSQGRITSPSMTVLEVVVALAEDRTDTDTVAAEINSGAAKVLTEVVAQPMGLMCLWAIDNKRLYGSRTWELYELCGRDIKRFVYHVEWELPNQKTGEFSMLGGGLYHASSATLEKWLAKRRFGRPGSFWALENPPTEPDYAFPID